MPRFVALLCALAIVLTAACASRTASGGLDPFAALPGKWGWENSSDCRDAPLDISFSADRKTMRLSHSPENDAGVRDSRRDAVYSVLAQTPRGLDLAMHGEDRLDPAGKPVTWELVLLSKGEYCWNRSDWEETACTNPVHRCEI